MLHRFLKFGVKESTSMPNFTPISVGVGCEAPKN